MDKLFFVYYVNLPKELEKMILSDRHVTLLKEGVKEFNGGRFARVVVRVRASSNAEDKARSKIVEDLLYSLKVTGQIVEYVV